MAAKNNSVERTRLGRLYCLAPPPLQDIDKCLEHLNIRDVMEQSESIRMDALDQLKSNLAWIYSEASLSPDQLKKLHEVTKVDFGLTHLEAELESIETGIFEFLEGEKFHHKDKYEHMDELNSDMIIANERTHVGARFSLDVPGLDSSSDRTAIIIRWYKQTENEPEAPIRNSFVYGSPRSTWTTFVDVSEYEKDTHLTVIIHDLQQQQVLKKSFFVKGNPNLKEEQNTEENKAAEQLDF